MKIENPTDVDFLTQSIMRAIAEHGIPLSADLNAKVDPFRFRRMQQDPVLRKAAVVITEKVIRVPNLMNMGKQFEIRPAKELELGQIAIISLAVGLCVTFNPPGSLITPPSGILVAVK